MNPRKSKWTDEHHSTLRQLIGAANDREIVDAEYLVREAMRLGVPMTGAASLMFAINNACRNTATWPRATTAMLHLSRKRDDDKRAGAPAQPVAVAPVVAPLPPKPAPLPVMAFHGNAIVDKAPRGYSPILAWADRLGIKRPKTESVPDYVARVYVRGGSGSAAMWVSDEGMRQWVVARSTPEARARIEQARKGGTVSGKVRRGEIVPVTLPVVVSRPAPVAQVAPTPAPPTKTAPMNGRASSVRDAIAGMLRDGAITPAQAVAMLAETVAR